MCLRESCETALKEKHLLNISQMEGFLDEKEAVFSKQLEALNEVFRKAVADDTPIDVSILVAISHSLANSEHVVFVWHSFQGFTGA